MSEPVSNRHILGVVNPGLSSEGGGLLPIWNEEESEETSDHQTEVNITCMH